ncbi:MAG: hypothetical protein R3D34_05035 [Nitratireductor sp.]
MTEGRGSDAARDDLVARLKGWDAEGRFRCTSLPYSAYFMATDADTQGSAHGFLRRATKAGQSASEAHTRQFERLPKLPFLPRTIPACCRSLPARVQLPAPISLMRRSLTADGRALDSIFINREFEIEEDERSVVRGRSEP